MEMERRTNEAARQFQEMYEPHFPGISLQDSKFLLLVSHV